MIRDFIIYAVSKLAEGIRADVSHAVADAVTKGIADGFNEVGVELVARPAQPVVRAVITSTAEVASPAEPPPAIPPQSVQPALPPVSIPSPKRGRGRPRKHTNYDDAHDA